MSSALARFLRRKRRPVVLLALAALGALAFLSSSPPGFRASSSAARDEPLGPHPIDHLIARGKKQWAAKVARQSQTLKQAEAEYRRRYGINPPPFFDEWFAFAQENDHVLVDEYDTLTKALLPFHALPPSVLRARTRALGQFMTFSAVTLRADGTLERKTVIEGDGESVRGRGWVDLLETLVGLPGVQGEELVFAINERAEPRAVFSWDDRKEAERILGLTFPPRDSSLYTSAEPDLPHTWKTWMNTTSWGWSAYAESCPPASPARTSQPWPKLPVPSCKPMLVGEPPFEAALRADDAVETYPPFSPAAKGRPDLPRGPTFTFSDDEHGVPADDFCWHPHKRFDHGHFFSDFRNVMGLYPAFSPGVMHGYSDIPIPSNYHTSDLRNLRVKINQPIEEDANGGYVEISRKQAALRPLGGEGDDSWDARRNELYWRGGATGGGSTPAGYSMNFQRHRLVRRFGAERDTTPEPVVRPVRSNVSDSALEVFQLPRNEFNKHALNIGFTSTVGCGIPKCCAMLQDEANDLKFAPRDPWAAAKRFKMIIDVDGMGFSARFLALFNSGAAVIKSTIYREYASDWLEPWVHFIPLSLEFSELPSIWSYFLGASLDKPSLGSNASALERAQARKLESAGDRRLHEIALAGETWRQEIDRADLDWSIYTYRLILEWRRLWLRTDDDFFAGR